ncbi:hypothetical protein ACF9IK_05275 [Kitasatospora hibisci]|uniref:hypothetical protein n=1 Tax=Kitasatospora hibisci TaxID=3369522 RepID=UPI0037552665
MGDYEFSGRVDAAVSRFAQGRSQSRPEKEYIKGQADRLAFAFAVMERMGLAPIVLVTREGAETHEFLPTGAVGQETDPLARGRSMGMPYVTLLGGHLSGGADPLPTLEDVRHRLTTAAKEPLRALEPYQYTASTAEFAAAKAQGHYHDLFRDVRIVGRSTGSVHATEKGFFGSKSVVKSGRLVLNVDRPGKPAYEMREFVHFDNGSFWSDHGPDGPRRVEVGRTKTTTYRLTVRGGESCEVVPAFGTLHLVER